MSDILRDSDKKNEIPKVKIPKFATGGICNDAIFPKLDVFSKIDEIAKDIQKQKDNAMAMEFTKCIGELLKKNGVVPKLTEYTANRETDNTFEARFGVSIDELDFSEHDKVFEDKIELLNRNLNLQKDKRCKVEIERNYLAERINQLKSEITSLESHMSRLRERCMDGARRNFDRGNYGCLTILNRNGDLETESEKLKQRIAELESRETEKPTKINLNDRVKVKLTPLGAEIYYHQYDELNKQIKERGGKQLEPRMPEIDIDGYTKFTLWNFIELYGEHIGMCKKNVIEPLYIELCHDEWKMRYNEEPIEKVKE